MNKHSRNNRVSEAIRNRLTNKLKRFRGGENEKKSHITLGMVNCARVICTFLVGFECVRAVRAICFYDFTIAQTSNSWCKHLLVLQVIKSAFYTSLDSNKPWSSSSCSIVLFMKQFISQRHAREDPIEGEEGFAGIREGEEERKVKNSISHILYSRVKRNDSAMVNVQKEKHQRRSLLGELNELESRKKIFLRWEDETKPTERRKEQHETNEELLNCWWVLRMEIDTFLRFHCVQPVWAALRIGTFIMALSVKPMNGYRNGSQKPI